MDTYSQDMSSDDDRTTNQEESDEELEIGEESKLSMWDQIQNKSFVAKEKYWIDLFQQDKTQFQIKFKENYLENCKQHLSTINDFIQDDETWNAIVETKDKFLVNSSDNEDEALLLAVDQRRYKVYKQINWHALEDEMETVDASDEEEATDVE